MITNLDLYTGKLTYREIEFDFTFNKNELRLIPPREKLREVFMWRFIQIGNGAYTLGDPQYIEDEYLVGKCNETGNTIIFFPSHKNIGSYNSVLIVAIDAYIIKNNDRDTIDKISFSSTEIDYIFSTKQAIDEITLGDNGIISIKTKDFDNTVSDKQEFECDGKKVSVEFEIIRSYSYKINQPPLSMHSSMMFEFEPTSDYKFILKLWRIAKIFIQYLCYRKNCNLSKVDIYAPYKDGKHEEFATMYLIDENSEIEENTLIDGRYISYEYISGYEGKILSDIASDMLYTRHIPDTYNKGLHIDAARFVMITAAFEWEFNRNYPDGVPKKESTKTTEATATLEIEKLINTARNSNLKRTYSRMKKLIKSDSLESEIIQVGKDYSEIMDVFGGQLYKLNHEELKYNEMGKRLADQRNHFAHGDLDKDFIGTSLLDLFFLEYFVYAIQLRAYGISDKNIQKAINQLFKCNIAIR